MLGDLFLLLDAVALVVIGIGFVRAERGLVGAIAIGFGALGLDLAAFAELIPAAVFLGTGALGVGLLFGDRMPEE